MKPAAATALLLRKFLREMDVGFLLLMLVDFIW
jgi:hypothetical protein